MITIRKSHNDSQIRIGIDARLWDETGVGRYTRNLLKEIEKQDKKNDYVLFFYKKASHPIPIEISQLRERNPHWKFIFTNIRWHSIREQADFPKLIKKEKLDVMHFPYFSVPFSYNRPFIVTIHDLIINHFPTGRASTLPLPVYYIKHFAYRSLLKHVSRKACKIITVSKATRDEIIDHLSVNPEKIVVTYEGIDNNFSENKRAAKAKYDNYFLFVGNAYPHKNPEILVEAFAKIVSEYPDTKLLFVGAKNYFYSRLQELVVHYHLEKKVIFLGKINDVTLQVLYRNAHALITPSLMEGFGLPGLEAMQQECLVLASDISVYKEIYGDAAVYFDPRSEDSIHATIQSVLRDKKKFAKYREKGLQRIKRYSWEKMTKETIQMYESCARIRQSK